MSRGTAKKAAWCVLIVFLTPWLTACGVLFGGTTKTISIGSVPSTAHLTTMPITAEFTTPASVQLERKNSYTIIAKKDGYSEAQAQVQRRIRTGPLILDILFTGLVGVVVDAATGGWYDLAPDNVTMSLEQTDPQTEGPDVITVTLSFGGDQGGTARVDATAPVSIDVIKN